MDSTNVNLNQSACIQTKTNIGSNTYYNICSNTQTNVPWGSMDWVGVIAICLIIYAAYRIIKYMKDNI